jgi:hypothetical protein
MPKFHLQLLPLINLNNDYHIEIDNAPYNENELYSKANSILFSNRYGSILLKGNFDLSNKDIPSLITINRLYLQISKEFLKSFTFSIGGLYKCTQEIEFILTFDDIKKIKGIEQELMNEYNCKIDYDNKKIYICLNEIKNVDIIHRINENYEGEESINNSNYKIKLKSRQKIKKINEDKIIKFQFDNIYSNKKTDENIQNEIINKSINNNSEMEDISESDKIFASHISDKVEEKKLETLSDYNLNMGNFKKNFIKIEGIKNVIDLINKNNEENYLDKILNPKIKNELNKLISDGKKSMEKNIKTNILSSININGIYLLLNNNNAKYGDNYKFSLNKLAFNNDISNNDDDLSDYKKIIFSNYINIFDNVIQKKNNNNNNININDYTYIILAYISQIKNKVDEIKNNKNINDNKIIKKYKKIISALKLFCILFLNCFMYKQENQYINDPNLFTNSFSDKVMSYRKRLLIEWCMEEQNDKLEKNLSKININNDIKSNYEELYSFGQIKKNLDNSNNKNISLFLRAKMSNNDEKISKNNMYYFTGYNPLHGENNRQFRDIFIDKYNNDWVSILSQSLLYEEKRDEYIIYSIELLSKYINNMKNNSKPIINVNNSTIYEINFILLKLYENYIKGDINEQIKYLKMLSYSCNLTKNYSSDHFIQYIICSTLLKIIPFIFPKNDEINREIVDKTFIKKLVYNLLIKSVEELLINSPIISNINNNILVCEHYTKAIKLILLSFLNTKIKNKLINNIISKINISPDSLNYFEENNPLLLTEHQKYSLLGFINNSLCHWKNAYNCFISSKEYKYALDACINYAISLIKEYNEDSDFKEIFLRLNEIKKNMPSLFVDFYNIFYLFIKYMSNNKNDNIDVDHICNLLKEFSSKEKYLCNDLMDEHIRGIIIDLLYKLLIRINKEKIATGNCEFIGEKYIKTNTELNMMHNTLWDIIKYKNNIFC